MTDTVDYWKRKWAETQQELDALGTDPLRIRAKAYNEGVADGQKQFQEAVAQANRELAAVKDQMKIAVEKIRDFRMYRLRRTDEKRRKHLDKLHRVQESHRALTKHAEKQAIRIRRLQQVCIFLRASVHSRDEALEKFGRKKA